MAITSKGFAGGPMTDDDFGAIAARGAWVESAAALAVTQPNTGTRTASIAAGTAVAHGVRAVNDAVISQALTAPGSGGQWYMLVLRRDWTSGVKTTTLQVLTGASTGSTTAPTAPPTSLPATFQSSVGTAQADQPLAWVWVSSASTALTIFDLRFVLVLRALIAATLFALQTLVLHSPTALGVQVPCLDGITYRVNGTTWQAWDSDWMSYSPGFQNINLNLATAQFRYRSGRVLARFAGTVTGTGNGTFLLALPTNGAGSIINGTAVLMRGSTPYRIAPQLYTTNLAQFFYGAPESPVTGSSPAAWTNGDSFTASFEYDPT